MEWKFVLNKTIFMVFSIQLSNYICSYLYFLFFFYSSNVFSKYRGKKKCKINRAIGGANLRMFQFKQKQSRLRFVFLCLKLHKVCSSLNNDCLTLHAASIGTPSSIYIFIKFKSFAGERRIIICFIRVRIVVISTLQRYVFDIYFCTK